MLSTDELVLATERGECWVGEQSKTAGDFLLVLLVGALDALLLPLREEADSDKSWLDVEAAVLPCNSLHAILSPHSVNENL